MKYPRNLQLLTREDNRAKGASFSSDIETKQLKYKDKADVFGIDEAQFCDTSLIDVCKTLAQEGKRIVVAGLEKDYQAIPFGPMPELLVDAEYVTKVNAICMQCGDPSNFSYRITKETKQVVVGEIDKYEARCRKCFQL